MQPISPQTATTLTTFMQGVVKSGTAARCLSGQLERGRQDRYGPGRLVRSQSAFTDDWLIAFAPVGNTKVAIAVVLPNQPGSATGAAYLRPRRQADPRRRAGRPVSTR